MMLLKFPPISMVLFQFFEKIFLCLNKIFKHYIDGKFFDKSLSIEKFDNEEKTIRQRKMSGIICLHGLLKQSI